MKIASLPAYFLLFSGLVFAEQKQGEVELYTLKRKSSFDLQEDARIPFWPIGWQKPRPGLQAPVVRQATPAPRFESRHFVLTSVFLGAPSLAKINGQVFEEGEVINVLSGQQRHQILLREVRDGEVVLEHEDRQFIVQIRRAEVGAKPVEEQAVQPEKVIRIQLPEARK